MVVKLVASGPVRVRENVENETGVDRTVNYSDSYLEVTKEFNDGKKLLQALDSSPVETGIALAPDRYSVLPTVEAQESWSQNVVGNANEITKIAVDAAKNSELSVVDVLTLWLQRTNSMRVRRALHSILIEDYDVQASRVE